ELVKELRRVVAKFAETHLPGTDRWSVGLSGGPDSLALTAAAAGLLPTTALIVDHGLQPASAEVAATARRQAIDLGCVGAQIVCASVAPTAARRLRPARPATPRWTKLAATTRCCWATRWTIRQRRCCLGWAAVRVPARWPGCAPTTRRGA